MYTIVSTRFDIPKMVLKDRWFDLLPTSTPVSALKSGNLLASTSYQHI